WENPSGTWCMRCHICAKMPESHWRRVDATGLPILSGLQTGRRREGKTICRSLIDLGIPTNQHEICIEGDCDLAHITVDVTSITAHDLTLSFGTGLRSTPSTKTCPFTPASKYHLPWTPCRWGPPNAPRPFKTEGYSLSHCLATTGWVEWKHE